MSGTIVGQGTLASGTSRFAADLSRPSIVTSPKAQRLPREGPSPGGGRLQVIDRTLFLTKVRSSSEPSSPDRPRSGRALRTAEVREASEIGSGQASPVSASAADLTKRRWVPKLKTDQEERKYAELLSKWKRAEAEQAHHARKVQERVQQDKFLRDERFGRLINSVMNMGSTAHQTAREIQDGLARERQRSQTLHADWEENVIDPLGFQSHRHMNPLDRAEVQRSTGIKKVEFTLPQEVFRLDASHLHDPLKKDLAEDAKEKAFHQAATQILAGSRSAPELRGAEHPRLPKSKTKEMLHPASWGQQDLQGTMLGRFAQVCEHGPGFRRDRRAGAGVFLPDESDGVLCAGTRKDRFAGYHDKGLLTGDRACRGMSSEHQTPTGGGSGAPAQDHFSFPTDHHVTDAEFPMGKKTFPERSH